MSIKESGRKGEEIARDFIKKYIQPSELLQADWLYKLFGEWVVVEVKYKTNKYSDTTFIGHGLNTYQINARLKFQSDTNIRCLLLCYDAEDEFIYMQYLDVLNNGKYKDLQSGIRVYDISNFIRVKYE